MDTEFSKHFGATDLIGVLKRLGNSKQACDRILEALGAVDGASAVEMIRHGELVGDVGDSVHDFFLDEIENEAEDVWSGTLYDPEDEDNPDTNYPVGIREYCGVFFVWALECDNAGYFLSREDALQYVIGNWDNVREDT
jgi:hypothetical protein